MLRRQDGSGDHRRHCRLEQRDPDRHAVRTEHLDSGQLNHAIFWGGLRLYFHPRYLIRRRFWHYRLLLIPALVANNLRYLIGALKGRIFMSRHRW